MTCCIPPFLLGSKLYSFHVENDALHVEEKEKLATPKPSLLTLVKELDLVANWTLANNLTLSFEEAQKFDDLLLALQAKVVKRILTSCKLVGFLIVRLQHLFCFGVLGECTRLQKKFTKISKAEKGSLQLVYKKEPSAPQPQKQPLRTLSEQDFAPLFDKNEVRSQQTLQELLKNPLDPLSFENLLETLKKHKAYASTLKRYEQITSSSFETKPLPKRTALKIAAFVEQTVFKKGVTQNTFLHTRHTKLGRDLHICKRPKTVYIIAKKKFSTLKGEGSYKELFSSLTLTHKNFSPNPEIAACLITKSTHPDAKENKIDINDTKIEIAFCKMLKNVRGFVELKHDLAFKDRAVKKMSLIFKKASGNLRSRIFKDERPITLREKLAITQDLLFALSYLHKKKIVHADLKLENSLYYEEERLITKSALCDLGFMFETDSEKAKINTRAPDAVLKWGQGGTIDYTAPELYGKKRHKCDFFALDVWAMGCILYQLHFRKPVPWAHLLIENKKNFDEKSATYTNKEALKSTQEAFKKEIKDEIESHYLEKSCKINRTAEEEYELLIYGMLRLFPPQRMTGEQAYKVASTLFNLMKANGRF
jgi:serine/threonine protein kinase